MNNEQYNGPIPPSGYSGSQHTQRMPATNHSMYQHPSQPEQSFSPQQEPEPKGEKNQKTQKSFLKSLAGGFVGAALACILAFCLVNVGGMSGSGSTVIGGSGSSLNISEDADRAEVVAEKALPSVAAIDVYSQEPTTYGGFIQSSGSLVYTGLGSGVVISEDGYILTNNHVVEGASALNVTVAGQEYEGTVVGTDALTDLAVVKIDATGLTAIELGDSDAIKAGQWVMALGSPFGLEQSVSTGIVSAASRTITVEGSDGGYSPYGDSSDTSIYSEMIQTDAAINPGNSGGALVDSEGRLIGINAVIESASGNYAGVGFAIPSNYAINIAQQIIDGKVPSHASLGVSGVTIDSTLAKRYDLPVSEGAYISAVMPRSAAEAAGLQEGDIITMVDGDKVESSTDLVAAIRKHNVGDTVEITFARDKDTKTVTATLGSDGVE